MTAMTIANVEVDGGTLFAEVAGSGPAVVLIHPGLWDRRAWDGQFGVFAKADVVPVPGGPGVVVAADGLAAEAGRVQRVLVRITPGIEADTHEGIMTGHLGSKFGLPPEQALEAIASGRLEGLHVHRKLNKERAGGRTVYKG